MTKRSSGIQHSALTVIAVVRSIQYDILSTNQCVAKGWKFSFEKGASYMEHEASGLQVAQIVQWGGCPWIVFSPSMAGLCSVLDLSGFSPSAQISKSCSAVNETVSDVTDVHLSITAQVTMSPIQVDKTSEAEILAHRLRGHVLYAPWCPHCRRSRGVKQHRRRSAEDKLQVALSADYCYIGDFKVLLLNERFSGCLGAISVSGDVVKDRTNFLHWLSEFGLTSDGGVSIQLITDGENTVASFIVQATASMNWMIERAAPQAHETVGAAERAVRTVKEAIATIRSELAESGIGLNLTPQSMTDILRYVCHTHNLFSHAHGSDRTSKELCSGGKLNKPTHAPFLGRNLAKIPDSIKAKYLTISRFVDALFISPAWNSIGCEVIGEVSTNSHLRFVHFHSRSIKHVVPLTWSVKFYQDLVQFEMKEHQHDSRETPREVLPPSSPNLKCRAS